MTQTHVTAGFRNAEWTLTALPEGTTVGVFPLRTLDGAATNGFLYTRGTPKAFVSIMHPREFLATHYMIPPLIEAGYGVFTQTPRAVGNDLRLEHEVALLDVAAGMAFLRGLGAERLVLLGNSGGSGLYALYNQQSLLAPERRLTRTPGGRPVPLAKADMPAADAFVLLSPHPGQGRLLMNAIDPSVADESDPFSTVAELDPFSPANGFREPPENASYAPDFVARYRDAQRARVAALDAEAHARIAARLAARKAGDRARGAYQSVMTVWRTDADLRCLGSQPRSVGAQLRLALGPRSVCVELRRDRFRAVVHARELALHVVGAFVGGGTRSDGAGDCTTGTDGALLRRSNAVPGRSRCDLRSHRFARETVPHVSRRSPRARDRRRRTRCAG